MSRCRPQMRRQLRIDRSGRSDYAWRMSTLHFICGKAASGKTTLGRELAVRHKAVFFCEDEWLTLLDARIDSLSDFVHHSQRLKSALKPHAGRLLELGIPVIFDFAGNTPEDRAWVRSIFEGAGADHVLHVITATDEACKARLRKRNETKPEGLYFGHVPETLFNEVTRYFVPPADAENLRILEYDAETPGRLARLSPAG
ncbi:AAA family ATPase [Mesorhizobium sp. IMUNJ 23232]|uniref:AAA family ATPase n=1 Tax=Mesorhizobium sp. IMUNJ 23232 TaxID=3376064 RepID=UPI003789DA4A